MPPYMVLSEVDRNYRGENGKTFPERMACLKNLQTSLKHALGLALAFQARPAGPQVATGHPQGAGRVKALIAFHEEQQRNTVAGDILNAEVIRLRQWIFRQGATLTPNGEIIWPKSEHVVEYDTDLARQGFTRIEFRAGLLFLNGKPLDTQWMVTAFSGPGYGIYVMSREGHIHVSSHAVGYRHHSSLLAGTAVAGAGEMMVSSGMLTFLSNKSGHYKPTLLMLLQVLHELQDSRVPMQFKLKVHVANGKPSLYNNVDEFMMANHFDNESWKCRETLAEYNQWLTPEFLRRHPVAYLTGGAPDQRGIFDLSVNPPRKLTIDDFKAMIANDSLPSSYGAYHLQ